MFAPGGLPPARNPLKIQKIGTLEKEGVVFQKCLPPEGCPPARNPLNPDSRKVNPDSKNVNPDCKKEIRTLQGPKGPRVR